ncbi:MAG TPA: hypothetical protein VF334_00865 [Polyangia bacterium]
MRTISMLTALVAGLAVAGCGDDAQHGGAQDMSIPDMTARDLTIPTACNPTDPMTDGSPCSAGCPAGTVGVNLGGTCKCFTKCTVDPECSCNRLCDPVTFSEGGMTAACLPGNDPGTRCGKDTGTGQTFGTGLCGQLTTCINADQAQMFRYCSYKCSSQADCPAQTTCQPVMVGGTTVGNACAYNSGPNGNKDLGQTCTSTDVCKSGQLCDGTCVPQCDGPGAACATGTCTVLDDTATGKVIGYVCK